MPIMYGRGEQQKSIRAPGKMGMKTCCGGRGREGVWGERGRGEGEGEVGRKR